AVVTFTDATTDWQQCRNDNAAGAAGNNDLKDPCDWGTGAVNANNSIYTEGDAVPQRLLQSFDTAGAHSVTFEYDFSKSNVYAYDFLTNVGQTQNTPALLNACGGV